jgi:hypothetical protein
MLKTASLTSALLVVSKGDAAPFARPDRYAEAAGTNIQLFPSRPSRPTTSLAPAARDAGHTRVSLRVNSARHLRLRVAAAHLGLTANGLMVAAIDHYLDEVLPKQMASHCACLAQGRVVSDTCCSLGDSTRPEATP